MESANNNLTLFKRIFAIIPVLYLICCSLIIHSTNNIYVYVCIFVLWDSCLLCRLARKMAQQGRGESSPVQPTIENPSLET